VHAHIHGLTRARLGPFRPARLTRPPILI
jgi:hypothetical protein